MSGGELPEADDLLDEEADRLAAELRTVLGDGPPDSVVDAVALWPPRLSESPDPPSP